jgi:hypothetical protein
MMKRIKKLSIRKLLISKWIKQIKDVEILKNLVIHNFIEKLDKNLIKDIFILVVTQGEINTGEILKTRGKSTFQINTWRGNYVL